LLMTADPARPKAERKLCLALAIARAANHFVLNLFEFTESLGFGKQSLVEGCDFCRAWVGFVRLAQKIFDVIGSKPLGDTRGAQEQCRACIACRAVSFAQNFLHVRFPRTALGLYVLKARFRCQRSR
jgi:hypothetical protein